jgi:hypothetical protein
MATQARPPKLPSRRSWGRQGELTEPARFRLRSTRDAQGFLFVGIFILG